MSRSHAAAVLVFLTVTMLPTGAALAQDMEPRAYAASPWVSRFSRSSPAIRPVESSSTRHFRSRMFALRELSRSRRREDLRSLRPHALEVAALPFAWAKATGRVGETTGQASRTGLADPRIKLSRSTWWWTCAVSARVRANPAADHRGREPHRDPPLGQYDRSKLVNLGANRWAFKPEIGVWLITANGQSMAMQESGSRRPTTSSTRSIASYAAPHRRASGSCELHSAASPVDCRRRDLVLRRQDDGRRYREGRPAAQLTVSASRSPCRLP